MGRDGSGTVTVTPSGAIVFGGIAHGTATFWTGQPDELTTRLTSANGSMFLARVSSTGALTWLRTAGNANQAWVSAVVALGEDVLVSGARGNAADDLVLGLGEPSETRLKTAGLFLARYRADGTLVWARSSGSNNTVAVAATQLVLMPDGGFVATGGLDGTAVLGPGEPNATTLTQSSGGWFGRFDAEGRVVWAMSLNDTGPFVLGNVTITVRPDGRILFATYYYNSLILPGMGGTGVTLTSPRPQADQLAVACYEGNGALRWVRTTEGPSQAVSRRVVALSDGTAVVSGELTASGEPTDPTYGTITFGRGEPNQTTVSVARRSGYLARYDADGNLMWVRQAPAAAFEFGSTVELPDHRILTVGNYGNFIDVPTSATFGPGEPGQVVLDRLPGTNTTNRSHSFMAWYNLDGTLAGARTIGRADLSNVLAVAVSPDHTVVVAGTFTNNMTFGPTDPAPVTYVRTPTDFNTTDGFLAKYSY